MVDVLTASSIPFHDRCSFSFDGFFPFKFPLHLLGLKIFFSIPGNFLSFWIIPEAILQEPNQLCIPRRIAAEKFRIIFFSKRGREKLNLKWQEHLPIKKFLYVEVSFILVFISCSFVSFGMIEAEMLCFKKISGTVILSNLQCRNVPK